MGDEADAWAYANHWRIATAFLALAMILLGIGVLAVTAFGGEAGLAGASLLATATFLLVFSVLVFLPRLARRGSVSFSLLLRRSIEDAERAVVQAIEAEGRAPRVELVKSRSDQPPRLVTADGISARFRIEAPRFGPDATDGGTWTEIVQSVGPVDEEAARALRDRIAARLAEVPTPAE